MSKPALKSNHITLKDNQMNIATKIETVTPEMARKYLEKNISNRPMRKKCIDKWAHAIKNGQWALNGETIKFADDGTLLDGQHRLMAILSTHIPVQMIVVRGLAHSAYETIDTGSLRRPADTLARNGEANSITLSTAARYLYIHEQLGSLQAIQSNEAALVNTADILETIDAHPGLRESVSRIRGRKYLRPLLSDSIASVLHYIFTQTSEDDADIFFHRLEKGDCLEHDNPVLLLRNRLMNLRDSSTKGRIEKVALTIKSFNLFRKRKSCSSLRWLSNEEFPKVSV